MAEAIRVIRNFCARSGLSYRFTVAIASGPVTAMTMKVPFLNPRLKRAFAEIAAEAQGGEPRQASDVFIAPVIPKPIILWIKEQYEKKFDAGERPAPSRT
jgi:hypothetical protein